MDGLKTLKDIKGIYSNGHNALGEQHTHTADLRKVAIEWVKANKSSFYSREGMIETKMWIKEFFNITEDELK